MSFHLPGFNLSSEKLTAEEAAELSARVAELTKAGLPLGPGLRALADELAGRRLCRALRGLADRLDAGQDFLDAIDSKNLRLPGHLRGIMLAGVRSGRLAEALEEYVDLQRSQSELRQRLFLTLAYPFVLLLFLAVMAVVAKMFIVDGFEKIFRDFGTALPTMTTAAIKASGPLMWFSIGLVALAAAVMLLLGASPSVSWLWPAMYRVPMLGPILRWSHLAQFSRLMGLLLEQRVALPEALRLSATGLSDANLAKGCRLAADDLERGRALDASLAARRQFPRSLIPIVQWGQQTPALADAFRAAAEMFEGRVRAQGALFGAFMLPVVLLASLTFVMAFVVAMFLPLIQLIACLS